MTRILRQTVRSASLAVAMSCGGAPVEIRAPQPLPKLDLDAKRLPAEEELDLLMRGAAVAKDRNARVAVAPIAVLGAEEQKWVGEAISELVTNELSRTEELSVVERAAVLKLAAAALKSRGEPNEETSQAAKLVGAKYYVVGKAIAQGERRFLVTLRVVDVQTGKQRIGETATMSADQLLEGIRLLAPRLAAPIVERPTPGDATAVRSMDAGALEVAAQARTMQYAGKLREAQELYARAMPQPTTAWRLEVDYLRLMTDVGLHEWVRTRSKQLLGAMEVTQAPVCERARLQNQLARRSSVSFARQAVMTSAACGDRAVLAESLARYAGQVESVDIPATVAAFRRAAELATGADSAWIHCYIDHEGYRVPHDEGDWKGDRASHYLQIAEDCERAGEVRIASISMRNAGNVSADPKRALELLQRAENLARVAGGPALYDAVEVRARMLRRYQQPMAAAALIQSYVREQFEGLRTTYGGLPSQAAGLDADFFRGLAVERPGPARELPASRQLLAEAAEKSFANALGLWAVQTRRESVVRAENYERIASVLRAEKPTDPKPADQASEANFHKRLSSYGLSWETLTTQENPPARGGGSDTRAVADLLDEEFWRQKNAKASEAQLQLLLQSEQKAARWLGSKRRERVALYNQAALENDLGHGEKALALNRESRALAVDDPVWETTVSRQEAYFLGETKPQEALNSLRRVADLQARIDGLGMPDALYRWCEFGVRKRLMPEKECFDTFTKAIVDRQAPQPPELQVELIKKLIELGKEFYHTTGGEWATSLAATMRLKSLSFEDPLARAQIDKVRLDEEFNALWESYRDEGARTRLAESESVREMLRELDQTLAQVVALREPAAAARVVAELPGLLPGMDARITRAFEWIRPLEGGSEFHEVSGRLHLARSLLLRDPEQRSISLRLSRTAFLAAQESEWALETTKRLVMHATSEASAWEAFAACRAVNSVYAPNRCAWGLAFYAQGEGGSAQPGFVAQLQDRARAAEAVRDALEYQRTTGARLELSETESLTQTIATLALVANDREEATRQIGALRNELTVVHPNRNKWAGHLDRLAGVALATDPARSFALAKEFDANGSVGEGWIAGSYARFALYARAANDTEAARRFLDRGMAAARAQGGLTAEYALYEVPLLAKNGDFDRLRAVATKAEADFKKQDAKALATPMKIRLNAAVALVSGKPAGAQRGREELVRLAKTTDQIRDWPCLATLIHEGTAGALLAANQCEAGNEQEAKAAAFRTRCTNEAPHLAARIRWRANTCGAPFPSQTFPWNAP